MRDDVHSCYGYSTVYRTVREVDVGEDDEPEWRVVCSCSSCGREHSISAKGFADRADAERLADYLYKVDADIGRRERETAEWVNLGLDEVTADALAFAGFESDIEPEPE